MNLDWDVFQVIFAISREGSLVQAVERLNCSASTVGRQLRRAEKVMETKLFDRLNTGLFPTPEGHAAIAVAERMERDVVNVNFSIKGGDQQETGLIRLQIPVDLMGYGLADQLTRFTELHPGNFFDVTPSDSPQGFRDRETDLVLRASNDPPDGLWGYRVATLS